MARAKRFARTRLTAARAALAIMLCAGPAGIGLAAHDSPTARSGPAVRLAQASEISADEAARIARERTGGRVLRVERRDGDPPRYRVKVLIDGERVRTLSIDARTGAVRD